MSDDQQQSPHYIPELDPENKKRPTAIGERVFLFAEYVGFAVCISALLVGIFAWVDGREQLLHIAGSVGLASALTVALKYIAF